MISMRQKMIELYGASILRKSALNIRDGDFLFELILKNGGYKTCLEIGTYRGCTAAVMSQFCDKVITIDLKQGRLESHGESFDRVKFWQELGINNIELHLVENDKEKAELIESLDFDFAFVDGAHDETVKDDFELVKRCGNVLFHDYDDRGQPCLNHVFDFVNSLPRHQIKLIDIFALWTA